MLVLFLAVACSVLATPHASPCTAPPEATATTTISASVAPGRPGQPAKALAAWLKLYHRGKIDYRSKENLEKGSIAAKFKVRDKSDLGNATWASDLRLIVGALREQDDAVAARSLAELASVGLDKGKYTYEMAPHEVRLIALQAIAKLTNKGAHDELVLGARGDWNDRKRNGALRAAALLGLGYIGSESFTPVAVEALSDGSTVTRIHAIEALKRIGGDDAAMSLIGIVERESDDAVLVTAAKALRGLYGDYLRGARGAVSESEEQDGEDDDDEEEDKQDGLKSGGTDLTDKNAPATARLAVRAAIQALGRTTWRADMVLVRLLDDFRTNESVPALIEVLERFRDNPDDVESGKLSGLLQVQVHELLVSMTGAVYPSDQPDKWRELWERDKGKIQVAEKRTRAPGRTAAAGFAGIPVQGTRIAFILDLSGSMEFPMKDSKERRLDYAKRELLQAIDGLHEKAMFNLITFNGDDDAEQWNKKLVHATDKNKKRFRKFVEKLRPLGGTNLWSGIEQAMNIETLEFGSHYETTIDEIFLLSDGAPSVGEVIDPIEILRLVGEINRFKEVRINTVFIDSPAPPRQRAAQRGLSLSPAKLMQRMAKQNGGKFRKV